MEVGEGKELAVLDAPEQECPQWVSLSLRVEAQHYKDSNITACSELEKYRFSVDGEKFSYGHNPAQPLKCHGKDFNRMTN